MKKLFSAILFWMVAAVALAQQVTYPIHIQSELQAFSADMNTSFEDYQVTMNWKDNAQQGWGQYSMFWFAFQAGIGGYTGLQQDANGKKVIFSIWNGHWTTTKAMTKNCQTFSGEGQGTQCFLYYDWQPGRNYKFTLKKADTPATTFGQRWQVVFNEPLGNIDLVVGIVELSNVDRYKGYGNLEPFGTAFVQEYYAGPQWAQCGNLPKWQVDFQGPFANNGSLKPSTAWTTNVENNTPGCQNSNVTTSSGYKTSMIAGANTVRTVKAEDDLSVNWKDDRLEKLDCVFNWFERNYQYLYPNHIDSVKEDVFYFRLYGSAQYGNAQMIATDLRDGRILLLDGYGQRLYGMEPDVEAQTGCSN